jgi:phosphate/phosphite/phosphonate ABC transporter binding protein
MIIFGHAFSQKLVLATYQYADNNRIANIQPLADYLSVKLEQKVETKSYPTVHLFIEAIQNDEVDIALINTFGYLLLDASSKSYAMKPYAVLQVKQGTQDNYKTAIMAGRDFPVDTISKIGTVASRSRLGLVAVGSTSGNLVPRLRLSSAGIPEPEKTFASVAYIGNHKTTTDALLEGRIDVAAVGSTEYFSAMADPTKAQKLKLLWLSPEIPLGPVLMHNRLDRAITQKIKDLLLNLHTENPVALESVKAGWSEAKQAEKYIPMDASYYNPFKSQLGSRESMEKILRQFAN